MTQPSALPRLRGLQLALATLLLGLANFVVLLDTTIANVAIPNIAGGLAVSPAQGTWVITSYVVAEAIVVPLAGWFAQRFGSLKVFVSAVACFGVCSVACGFAPSFQLLVLFRVLQGLCGGLIMPMSQTLLLTVCPPEKTQQALGFWTMTTVAGPILGPLLGGLISDSVGWRWIFFINAPLAVGVVFAALSVLRGHETPTRRVSVDYVGLALLIVWVGALQIMLDKGKELEWFSSPVIVVLALVSAIGLIAFLIWELTVENPIVDLRIFRNRGFVAACIASSVTNGAFFGSMVLIMLWLQTHMGYTATNAGYVGALNGVPVVIMSPIVAYMATKMDPRRLITFGVLGLATVALWRSMFTTEVSFEDIAVTFLAQGFFMPFYIVPSIAILLGSVRSDEISSAAGLSTFLRTTAAAFATSSMTTAWEAIARARRSELVSRLNGPQDFVAHLGAEGLSSGQAIATIEHLVDQQAYMLATSQIFLMTMGAFTLAVACIWFAPWPAKPRFPRR